MTDAEKLTALKLRLPDETNDALLQSLILEAGAAIKSLTNRDEVPTALGYTQVKLAAVAYNRMGIEGEASHAEGGVIVGIELMPENLRREIAPWRLARTR